MIIRRLILTVSGETEYEVIGKKITLIRSARGLSQSNLARKLQVSRSTVQAWERGELKKESQLLAIAAALGVHANQLNGEENPIALVRELVQSFD